MIQLEEMLGLAKGGVEQSTGLWRVWDTLDDDRRRYLGFIDRKWLQLVHHRPLSESQLADINEVAAEQFGSEITQTINAIPIKDLEKHEQ